VAAIRDLEALGATVYALTGDAGDPAQLAAAVAAYERQCLAPIRGVVHSAAFLHDELLVRADERAFDAVLRTKAAGAWYLHQATRALPLDFFVLYSSMSSLVGQYGQGAYAAGNAFLDALAHHRRAAGLPALAINWGPWAAVGLVARGAAEGQLAAVYRITLEEGIGALARLLTWDVAQAAVVGADWNALPRTPFLAALNSPAPAPDPAPDGSGAELLDLLALPRAERQARLTDELRVEAARVLRLDVARLAVSRPLTTFGMDSILAVEFRNRIQARYHVQLSLVDLFTAPVARLAARVAELIEADEGLERLLREIEQLSPEEAHLLLAEAEGAPTPNGAPHAEPPGAGSSAVSSADGAARGGA
jgi:hypothetical protein